MKINRMAEEQIAPAWAFEDVEKLADSEFFNEYISQEEIERINDFPVSDMTEDDIIIQRDHIEHCAENNNVYHYNSEWPDGIQSTLKEYATVCGLDMSKFKAVHPYHIKSITVVANEQTDKGGEKTMENDPFKLDEKANMSHMKEANWETIKKQDDLDQRPSMEGAVIPLRGGEDYYANSDPQTARGQNSITDPNAIETYAESEEEDTGARLRRENQEKEQAGERKHIAWENEKLAAMEGSEIIPKGSVFATEVMNAQPGLNSDKIHMGVYSDMDLKDLPEKTEGEKIAEGNEARRQEIQGEGKEAHEFILEENPKLRGISDTFAEELAKKLKR